MPSCRLGGVNALTDGAATVFVENMGERIDDVVDAFGIEVAHVFVDGDHFSFGQFAFLRTILKHAGQNEAFRLRRPSAAHFRTRMALYHNSKSYCDMPK